jgi:hypothetical protein
MNLKMEIKEQATDLDVCAWHLTELANLKCIPKSDERSRDDDQDAARRGRRGYFMSTNGRGCGSAVGMPGSRMRLSGRWELRRR